VSDVQIAVISDTHVPERAESIPERFRDLVASADHVIHAGDIEDETTLTNIRSLSSGLTAVHGNADGVELGLPAVAEVTLGGVTFVVIHGTYNPVEDAVYGSTGGSVLARDEWLRAVADTARARTRSWDGAGVVGIGGHTHRVEDAEQGGVRVLNPGSATGAAPADDATMMTVTAADGVVDVTLREA